MSTAAVPIPAGKIFNQPKGLFLVSGVELWERFSYYGMLGLLVLFLTANASTGGFNWPTETALKLMGFYTGFVFASPALGGWITSRFLGERKSILYGGLLVFVGHLLLGGPVYFPAMIDMLSGQHISPLLDDSALSYNAFFSTEAYLADFFRNHPLGTQHLSWLVWGYSLKLWSFLVGLALIIVGTGLIKPAVSSIINHFYPEGGEERQTGFTIFMVSIYIGSFTANFIAGTLGEKIGWHAGFTAAAIGMFIGVAAYLIGQQRYLGDIGQLPQNPYKTQNIEPQALKPEHKKRIALILLMGLFTVVYAVAFYQKGGLLNLYTQEKINRTIFDFEIPATWFLAISTGTFILFAPFITKLISRKFPSLEAIQKLAIGLALIACGYVILFMAESFAGSDTKISTLWMVFTYILFGIGDVFVWPAQIAAAAALAPKHLTSFIVGSWYLTIGLGSWFTGYVGALSIHYSHSTTFFILAAGCLLAALILIAIRRSALKLASGVALN